MKSGKVFLGLLAGLATGAVLGILFAPDKGSKTRRKILNKGEDLAEDAKEKLDEFLKTVSEKYETTKQEAKALALKGKALFTDASKDAHNIPS